MKEAASGPDFAVASATPTVNGETTHGGTGKPIQDPYPTLGPLLSRRAAAYAASGTSGSTGPAELVPLSVYVDTKKRIAEIVGFLTRHGVRPGRTFVGQAGDVFGGALTATVPVSLLVELAAQPGVQYVRERIPPRSDRTSPTFRFPDSVKVLRGGGGRSEQP